MVDDFSETGGKKDAGFEEFGAVRGAASESGHAGKAWSAEHPGSWKSELGYESFPE
jgi:hypothetical protein